MRSVFALVLVLAMSLCGCSKAAEETASDGVLTESTSAPVTQSPTGERPADAKAAAPGSLGPGEAVAVAHRSVIRRATLTVRVDNVEKAEAKVNALVSQLGGYVEGSESNDLSSPQAQIAITARVPVATFDRAISGFEALGTRLNKTISGEDVTAQVLDYGARLKTMRVQEEVYRQLLKQSRKMDDVIALQNQLLELRSKIEGTTAQLKGLTDLAALSTIKVSLVQSYEAATKVPTDENWASEAWAKAVGSGLTFLKTLTIVLMWLVVYSPIWLAIVLLIRYAIKVGKSKPNPPDFPSPLVRPI